MGKRFSNLLLSGKVATLPILMQNALAQYSPTFTDVMNTNITQIQVPVSSAINLVSLGSPPYSNTHGSFPAVNGAAQICSALLPTSPSIMSVVLTGLKPNDTLFVATATSLGGNESLNSNIRLGTQNLVVPIVTSVTGPKNSVINLTVGLNLNDLRTKNGYPIIKGGIFYLQSVAIPDGSVSSSGIIDWSKARVSELDVITVGPCVTTYAY